jgi:hypothetical protein
MASDYGCKLDPLPNKSWIFRYMVDGRARAMGLGSTRTVTLAGARERARGARELLLDGKDPIDTKRAAVTARRIAAAKLVTFKQCAEEFLRVSPLAQAWSNDIHPSRCSETGL